MLRKVVSAVVLLAAVVGVAVASVPAHADERPVDFNMASYCDSTTGTWKVGWVVHNQTPVTIVIERAVDPTTGQSVPLFVDSLGSYVVAFFNGPTYSGTTTTAGLHVWIRRIDRETSVQYGGTFTLSGTCTVLPPPPETDCSTSETARYKHTFDGATGTATVEIVGPALCPEEFGLVSLDAYGEVNPDIFPESLYPHDNTGAFMSATVRKVSMRVALPTCRAIVRLFVGNPMRIAGSPGSQSTGPLAQYQKAGVACVSAPSVSSSTSCAGSGEITMSNGSTANTPVKFTFHDVPSNTTYRTLSLEPGESTTVGHNMTPYRGRIDIYVHGTRVHSAKAPSIAQCKGRDRPPLPPGGPKPPTTF